jgi:processive 1,2-diacylglycerol beta-glucosyltransferase
VSLRVLLLAADVGESHAEMARTLAADLLARDDVAGAEVIADFSSLGPRLARVLGGGYRVHVGEIGWSYDLAYRLFTGVGAAQRLGERALARLSRSGLAATIARHRPDVVVSTHPVLSAAVAGLRAAGALGCPAAGVVAPLGGLAFWIQPALDLHLFLYAEALEASRPQLAGRPARAVRPLVREEFFAPLGQRAARTALGIAAPGPVVVISGGGWGAGDVAGAIRAARAAREDAHVIAVAGRNASLERRLRAEHAAGAHVTVTGFTDRMRDLLCAADVFVSATAGSSTIEAQLCGCPTVCYGFAIGHVRDNVRALARHGLARAADTPEELTREIARALAQARPAIPPLAARPRAADLVVDLARPAARERARAALRRAGAR